MDCIDLLFTSFQYNYIFSKYTGYDEYKQYTKNINNIILEHIKNNKIDSKDLYKYVFNNSTIINNDFINVLIKKSNLNSNDKNSLCFLFNKIDLSNIDCNDIKVHTKEFIKFILDNQQTDSIYNNKLDLQTNSVYNNKLDLQTITKKTKNNDNQNLFTDEDFDPNEKYDQDTVSDFVDKQILLDIPEDELDNPEETVFIFYDGQEPLDTIEGLLEQPE